MLRLRHGRWVFLASLHSTVSTTKHQVFTRKAGQGGSNAENGNNSRALVPGTAEASVRTWRMTIRQTQGDLDIGIVWAP
ncbi:hypothetical protein BU24DRAFT_422976 [Aaosphaeria arxii CBS 175.79]|uniref:Uncharacterized protein n=1 Tax=Aaosphaeria arxii CBS 175.79 TaxID=1450172 RepID=A0A6A5XUH9_9PLEO|nr:uncharacterized protein BU24DRAFT_422976 [Aaosphaeria arxii CBS 175.79]KAF2016603.1 hypothetical protein BU24DRAFT_422976 [Aaosphaeria arxii CBS 175.79]